jgi:hypothetical protein
MTDDTAIVTRVLAKDDDYCHPKKVRELVSLIKERTKGSKESERRAFTMLYAILEGYSLGWQELVVAIRDARHFVEEAEKEREKINA